MPKDIVDAADVRVRHLSRQVHLALEPDDRALVSSNVRQDGFERDPLAQLEILGLVKLAHPAFRQEADDAETEGDDLASPEDGLTGRPGLTRLGACGIVGVGRRCRGRRTCLDLPTEQPLDREMGIDARDHLLPLDRLRDEIHRARFEAPYTILRVIECRHEDHRGVTGVWIGFEAAAGLVAVEARHDAHRAARSMVLRGERLSARPHR